MPNKLFRIAYAMNFLIQSIFSLLCPAALIIGGGWLLRERCGLGNWVMIVAIVFGVLCGLFSFFQYLMKTIRHLDYSSSKGEGENGTKL